MSILPFADSQKNEESSSPIIDLRQVDKYYKSAAGDYHALKSIDPVSYTHLTLPTNREV